MSQKQDNFAGVDNSKSVFTPWMATNAVLVSLIIKTAFDEIWQNIAPHTSTSNMIPYEEFSVEKFLIYLTFFIILLRFQGGATRFGQIKESRDDAITHVKNVLFSFLLFMFFYFMSHSMNDSNKFVKFTLYMHVVDLFWFIITIIHSAHYKLCAKLKTSLTFFLLTIITIAGLLILKNIDNILTMLLFVSFVDFFVLWPFYLKKRVAFIFESWELSNDDRYAFSIKN